MIAKKNALVEFGQQFDVMKLQLENLLPKNIPVEQFRSVVLTAMRENPDLLQVERRSLFNACMRAAEDGLLPDGREGALVVYSDKNRGKIAQWLVMIGGMRKKARNSGEISTWQQQLVHERDVFDWQEGDDPHIWHKPALGDRGSVVAAYSIAVLKSGDKSREVMDIAEIHKIRQRSRGGSSGKGPWFTDFGEMAKKTVARRHAKVLPMSRDVEEIFRRDDDDNGIELAANKPKALPGGSMSEVLSTIAPLGDDLPMSDEGEVIDQEAPPDEEKSHA